MSMFQKATKKKAKARVALIGPPGSGKTFTALTLAKHLGGRVAVIDTERGSASKYAGKQDGFVFDVCEPQTFEPKAYIAALKGAAADGYDVVIIDSLSHAWEGDGGILDQVDKRGGRFEAWKEMSPQTRSLIDAILVYPGHVIATMRVKTEWVVEKNDRGKSEPRNVGLAPKFKEGLEYEFDVVGMLDDNNVLRITKTRCSALAGGSIAKPGKGLADALLAWLDDGAEAPKAATKPVADAGDVGLADRLGAALVAAQSPKEGKAAKDAVREAWSRLNKSERAALGEMATAWKATADDPPPDASEVHPLDALMAPQVAS
jgi:DNA polymerase III delta prime subunit